MARKRKADGANKSAAIRNYKEANPSAGPNEIARALDGDGVSVTAGFVSTVLSNDRRKAGKSVRRSKGADASIESLIQAKKLAEQMGGIDRARAALDALSKILA